MDPYICQNTPYICNNPLLILFNSMMYIYCTSGVLESRYVQGLLVHMHHSRCTGVLRVQFSVTIILPVFCTINTATHTQRFEMYTDYWHASLKRALITLMIRELLSKHEEIRLSKRLLRKAFVYASKIFAYTTYVRRLHWIKSVKR